MSIHGSVVPCEIKDLSLAEAGKRRIEWMLQSMPVLASIRKQFIKTQAFSGVRIAARLPVTAAAANLVITLRDSGAKIRVWGSDAHTTEDDVAASLVKDYQVPVFATSVGHDRGELPPLVLADVLAQAPQLLVDHTGELAATAAVAQTTIQSAIVATREGARRLRTLAGDRPLGFPVVASHRSLTRRVFYSRIGIGQSTLDAVSRSMNILIAGLNVVVIGFGKAGRGIAARAKGLGAVVMVTEIDPIRAAEAAMEGYRVLSMTEAAGIGGVFLATSSSRNVIGREHYDKLRNGAILANAGHSDVELDMGTLAQIAGSRKQIRSEVEEWVMRDGRRIYLLAGGRSIRQAMDEALPASVLDLTFANRALSAEYLVKSHESLPAEVYGVPLEIDQQVARLKLEAMGIKIDRLTVEQEQYLASLSE
jgi:adenosylhomocysteinase